MTIRKARPSDREAACALMAELVHPQARPGAFRRAFEGVLRGPDSGILVSCHQRRLTGLLAWSLRPMLHIAGRLFRIDELVVSNAARGQGVGRELLRAA
ncbi:MAG: N-acetyltransferase, partial [Elusimicrobia bacterium]|nr:N-acetyltransferase [Elusimicrobiota bacterium]